ERHHEGEEPRREGGHAEEGEEVERARLAPQEDDADEEAHVAELRHPERLHGGPRRRRALVVETDEKVRAESHQLPEHEELEEVRGEDEAEHREGEEGLVEVIAAEGARRLAGEVAEG